jgi:prolyl oligopeptidase
VLAATMLAGCGADAPTIVDLRPQRGAPPPTRREDLVEHLHGVPVADPYRWLEDGDDPSVRAWSDAQDAYARATLDRMPAVDALRRELTAQWDREGIVVPVHKRAGRYFYGRRLRGRDRVVYFVRDGDGPERVLLDPARLDPSGGLVIQSVVPSPDGRTIAYRVSQANADAASLRIRDVDSGREQPVDDIEGARFAAVQWTPDSRAFYYTGVPCDPAIPPSDLAAYASVRRHELGRSADRDEIEFGPLHDARRLLMPRLSDDGRYLIVHATHGSSGPVDIYYRELAGDGTFVPLVVGADARTEALGYEGALYLHTSDTAPRFRVVRVDPKRPGRADWTQVVPQRAMTLDGFAIIEGHLVLSYLDDVNARVRLYGLDSGNTWEVDLPAQGAVTGLWGDADQREALLVHSSLSQAPRIFRVPIPERQAGLADAEVWYAPEPEAAAPALTMERLDVTSADGTTVPVFVLHRTDLELDGSHPTVLYGYGGFGISVLPAYSAVAQAWARRGGVWAIANLRGGGEFGEDWHRAGKGARKQNVFDDFIASAEALFEGGYTRAPQLGIMGGSNGGLLVGAASTQRPDLFGAVVCRVPLLDMVRYHRFGVGPFWIDEYGSARAADEFRTLLSYSPYHQIRAGVQYPPLLMMAADSDDRVDPLHARKYVAAMQATEREPGLTLLRVERNAGHGGPDSLRQNIDATAHMLAFLLHMLDPGHGAG